MGRKILFRSEGTDFPMIRLRGRGRGFPVAPLHSSWLLEAAAVEGDFDGHVRTINTRNWRQPLHDCREPSCNLNHTGVLT
jgi:hypothetical protein